MNISRHEYGGKMNDVLKAIKERRSVRSYNGKQITPENLDLLIEAARYAPSAHNEQPCYFTVVQNKQLLDDINIKTSKLMAASDNEWVKGLGSDPKFRVTYDAPTVIFVSGKKDAVAYETDCSAAIENMLIAATSLGISSVWLGLLRFYLNSDEARTELQIPDGYKPYYGISFGYSDAPALPAPNRNTDNINYIR